MNRKYSPFNNFVGGALKFFFPRTQPSAPKGYMTVADDGTVNVDTNDVVILDNADYVVKSGDRHLVCPAYLGNFDPRTDRLITFPDPSLWKGRRLAITVVGWFSDTGLTASVRWTFTGTFSNYSQIVLGSAGSLEPGTTGSTVPPFGTTVVNGLFEANNTYTYIFYCDGVGWAEVLEAQANTIP